MVGDPFALCRGLFASRINRRSLLVRSAGAGALLASSGALARYAAAQEGTPGAVQIPPGCTLVAENLINPRYLAVASDGSIYVTEAGTGGDEELVLRIVEPGASPTSGTPEARPAGNRGLTGQVSRIAPDGTTEVVVSGLPSYSVEEPVGPAGITIADDGTIWMAVGGPGPATPFVDPLPNENSVVSVDPATGTVTSVADIGAYEKANNPHPASIDSNLYGIAVGPDGMIYVADAGGNTVYKVDPASGSLEVVAVIEDIPLPEGAMGPPMLEPVPTSIAPIPEGGLYVGLLSGGPFPPGAAKILQISADGTATDAVTGLTMVVDVKIGPDGNLYASQISLNLLSAPPEPGNVVRINADGSQEVVVEGLPLPNGIDFDAEGNLYIVANAVSFGPPTGMVLRCDGVAAPGGMSGTPTA